MGEFALGQSVSRFEDQRLLKGRGLFVDDTKLPRMVYGVVLRSPHAHADILSIDSAEALAAPGVLDILTGVEWAASGWGDLPVGVGRKLRDGSPHYRCRYPALVENRVRWVGDYVAFVVADTKEHALDAAEMIEVDYNPLPSITSTADASKPGAPLVWDDCADNICFVQLAGDKDAVDAAFAEAEHVVEHTFDINRVTAAATEPRACVGDYNSAEDHYTIYTTLQRAHPYRAQLAAEVLKVPENKVRVIAGDVGGSFGMKSAIYNEVALVLLASKRLGRPVKWTSTRTEAFLSDGQGRDNLTTAAMALDKDHNFLAIRVQTFANVGAYLQAGGETFIGNLGTLAGVYKTPVAHVDITAAYTNTPPVRPYRGNGRPEAAFVIERLIDVVAAELNADPIEIRRRNLIPADAMPYKTALTFTYDCGEFERGMDMALEMSDYAGFPARSEDSAKRGKLRGIGFSNSIERAAAPGGEGAEIRFDRSGTATIFSGAVNQGQGHETVFKQVVCDKLGMDPADISYISGDTDTVFYGEGTGGSRSATIGGAAMLMASDKIIAKATKIAAHMLEVSEDDVSFEDGVFSSAKSNRSLTIKEVAKAAVAPKNLPEGMEPGLVETAVYVTKLMNYPNGCHVCELEIDEETGTVEILAYNVVDDVGTVMNPMLLHGQIQGGVAQGIGQVLMEDIKFDPENGQILTGSFLDYAMPHAADFSAIHVKSNAVPTATNPLGVKGAGEAGNVGALPAIGNALVNALAAYGVRSLPMPATPERLWRIIEEAKSATG
ncbi:MAG: xanthine dehydrogenase family protein molybdopterin-binding subunit [Alphaproteobacteria bacterium]|nr:xanthine dehydrogenase family protein molybdopterin-binding subunit [Alphaproteobacteria bacterium]